MNQGVILKMISDRVRQIREAQDVEGKKMTQEAFGKQLGVSRSVIANLEYGRVEPTEAIIKLVCATFNVIYAWLKEGVGDMFVCREDRSLDTLVADHGALGEDIEFIRKYLGLSADARKIVRSVLKEVL